MEYLKIWLITVLCFWAFIGNAQITNEQKEAYAKSLYLEVEKDYDKAIKALEDLKAEKSYEINLRLGWLHYNYEKYISAEEYYQKANDILPYAVEPKMGLVNVFAALQNWTKVENMYLEILKISPSNTYVLYQIGFIYYNRADYQRGLTYFEKVVNLYPTDYSASIMFAWTKLKLGKTSEAKILFNKILMMYPDNKSASEGLSYCN